MQWKPNTTVSAIAANNGKYLIVEEKIQDKLVYNQPAGHLERGESLIEAIKREVLEETAWEFEPESLVGIYLYPNPNEKEITYLRFCFYGHCVKHHSEQKLDKGIVQAIWLSPEQLKQQADKLRSPMVIKCIEDYLAGNRIPLSMLHHY